MRLTPANQRPSGLNERDPSRLGIVAIASSSPSQTAKRSNAFPPGIVGETAPTSRRPSAVQPWTGPWKLAAAAFSTVPSAPRRLSALAERSRRVAPRGDHSVNVVLPSPIAATAPVAVRPT